MERTKEEIRQFYADKKTEIKTSLDNVLGKTLADPSEIKKLTDHFKIEGLYNFSFMNTMMVLCQGGTIAQSFNKWKDLGRFVKNKQQEPNKKDIYVWKPRMVKEVNEAGVEEYVLKGFNLTRVWDISDTDGEDLSYMHNSREITALEYATLKDGIIKTGVAVSEDDIAEGRGYAKKASENSAQIVIAKANNEVDKLKTLIHEAAHVWLGHLYKDDEGCELSGSVKEVEAEAVGYIVQSYYGLDIQMSVSYIAGWNTRTNSEEKPPRKTKILTCAEKVIRILSPKDKKEEEKKVA